MVPLEGPHKNKTEAARTKAAPLATAVSAKRATRSKPEKLRHPVGVSESVLEPQTTTVVSEVPDESDDADHVSEDRIRLCAYYKWVVAGMPEGDGVGFWLDAERELLAG